MKKEALFSGPFAWKFCKQAEGNIVLRKKCRNGLFLERVPSSFLELLSTRIHLKTHWEPKGLWLTI